MNKLAGEGLKRTNWGDYMEFNGIDYFIILVIALSITIGYMRGLVGAIGGIITTLASLGIAYRYRNAMGGYLEEQYGVVGALTALFEKRLSLPGAQGGMISSLPLVNTGWDYLHQQIAEFAYLIVVVVCFLILYIVSKCLLKLIYCILERVLARGIMGRVNSIGGMLLISAQSILIMAVVAGILKAPVILGADIGIGNAGQLQSYMEGSLLFPLLIQICVFFKVIVGIGV